MEIGLIDFMRGLGRVHSIETLLPYVLSTATKMFGAQRAMFAICDSSGRVRRAVPHNMLLPADGRQPFSEQLIREVLERHASVVVDDTSKDQAVFNRESVRANDIRCMMGVPVIRKTDEALLGVLYIDRTGSRWHLGASTREVTAALEAVATTVSLALQNFQAAEERKYRDRLMTAFVHHVRGTLQVLRTTADGMRPEHLDELNRAAINSTKGVIDGLTAVSTSALHLHKLETAVHSTIVYLDPTVETRQRAQSFDLFAKSFLDHSIVVEALGQVPMIRTDPTRFGMLVDELLLNAIRYSANTKPVSVWVQPISAVQRLPDRPSSSRMHSLPMLEATDDSEFIRWSIHNANRTGPIPSERIESIFEPFVRGANDSRGPSTGLGLSIVREIVTSLGGVVWADSDEEGTTFCVELPTDVVDDADFEPPTPPPMIPLHL